MNVFGFPTAPELSGSSNNLGFLDQELAFTWVQDNIAQFGGDKSKVTIMVRMISRDARGHTMAKFYIGRASLQGLHPSHLLSPAGTRLTPHHFVRASCYLEIKFPHPRHLTSRSSTHLRLRSDVRSHRARCDWSACVMSQLALYETIRTEPVVACLLMGSTSTHSILSRRRCLCHWQCDGLRRPTAAHPQGPDCPGAHPTRGYARRRHYLYV